MIEVFKTDVKEVIQAKKIIALLHQRFPGSRVNFDLDDCDKVLRIEGDNFIPEEAIKLVKENGAVCDILR